SNRMNGDRFLEGLSIAKELVAYADNTDDKTGYTIAHRWYGSYLMWSPDYETALLHLKKAVSAYEELKFNRWIDDYGLDPKARSLNYIGEIQAYLGSLDQGIETLRQSMAYTESLESPYELNFLHQCCNITHFYLNNLDEVKKHSESSLEISLEKNLPWTEGAALIFAGWSDHRKNKPGSFEQIVRGLDQINSYGSTSFDSAGHWWLAYLDAAIHAHQYDVAMEKLQYILETIKSLGCEQVLP
ncbi:uncharacterized protein METZ01_LOCUS480980, partial [marine metagenome]